MAETSFKASSGARNRRYSISLGLEKDQRGMHFPALAVVPTRSQSGIAYLELKAVKASFCDRTVQHTEHLFIIIFLCYQFPESARALL
jgi:hypothetical protein